MKPKVYVLVFDGFADWEPAHALCQINQSGRFDVVAAGLSEAPVKSMGGLSVMPEITIDKIDPGGAAIFILPGGTMWEQPGRQTVLDVLGRMRGAHVPIAAICGATLEVARSGLMRGVRHTSNAKEYLETFAPDYAEGDFYVDELAVADNGLITASGLGSVEFAREIIKELKIHSDADTRMWFDMFKNGVIPESLRSIKARQQ
jgi:putative intracellular protease/amidase